MSKEAKDTAEKPKKTVRGKGKKKSSETSAPVNTLEDGAVTEVAVTAPEPVSQGSKQEPVQDVVPASDVDQLEKVTESVQELKPIQKPTQEPESKKKVGRKNRGLSTASALITLPAQDKERFAEFALKNGMSLSGLIRLAINEYMHNHEWMN